MKCPVCGTTMDFKFCNDDPNKDIAYNVYECFDCMIISKENLWKHKGIIWIFPNNTTEIS